MRGACALLGIDTPLSPSTCRQTKKNTTTTNKTKTKTKAADWWSFGVLLFELVSGTVPFAADDRLDMYRAIAAAAYRVPPHFSPVRLRWRC